MKKNKILGAILPICFCITSFAQEPPPSDILSPLEKNVGQEAPSPSEELVPMRKPASPAQSLPEKEVLPSKKASNPEASSPPKKTRKPAGPSPRRSPRHTAAIKIQAGIQQITLMNDDTLEDSGQGFELQLQSWPMEDAGFALVVGHSSWDLNIRPDINDIEIEDTISGPDGTTSTTNLTGKSEIITEGDITATPIGFSFFSDIPITPSLSINPNIGLRFLLIEADGQATKTERVRADIRKDIEGKLRAENGVIGAIGVDARLALTEFLSLLLGVGYQFDIIPAEVKASFADDTGVTHEIEFDSFYGQVAAAVTF